jgi:hypothetical protein
MGYSAGICETATVMLPQGETVVENDLQHASGDHAC